MQGLNSAAMWHPPAVPSQEPPTNRLRSARPQRCQPGLLTWRRAQTPFCPGDRALKAYRHIQNPRKPAPPPTPAPPPLRRPGTAAPMMEQRRQLLGSYPSGGGGVLDTDIINWVRSASVNEKQLAYKLMRCLALASTNDATEPTGDEASLPSFQQYQMQQQQQQPQILSIERQPHVRPFTPIRDRHFGNQQQQQQQQRQSKPLNSYNNAPNWISRQPKFAEENRTDAQALFGTMGDREFRMAKQEQLARVAAANGDFAYSGAGFLNARPTQRSTFSVHPEWVSEKYARLNTQQDGM